MPVKLKNELIPVTTKKLCDGQLAQIVGTKFSEYRDRIVQRHGNKLISVGMDCGYAWSGYFDSTDCPFDFRVLTNGELIEVLKNNA